jgi:D-beta-D-heptose 7-phosphate kinase/D-beta-D-heptose 1-phosphate adenosyltransferase
VILADGCFDPIHLGHIRYLQAAAKHGRLIVRVARDDEIQAKGREPFQTRWERAETLRALGVVDDVMMFHTLAEAVLEICPQMLVKGKEWDGRLPKEVLAACQLQRTRIMYTDTQRKSSTERLST